VTLIGVQSFYYSTPLAARDGANNDYQLLGSHDHIRADHRAELVALLARLRRVESNKRAFFSIPIDDNTFVFGRIEDGGEDARGRPGRVVVQGAVVDRGDYVNSIKGALFSLMEAYPWQPARGEAQRVDRVELAHDFNAWSARSIGIENLSEAECRRWIAVIAQLAQGKHVQEVDDAEGDRRARAMLALNRPDTSWSLAIGANVELQPSIGAQGPASARHIESFDFSLMPSESSSNASLPEPSALPQTLPNAERIWQLVAELGGVGSSDDLRDFMLILHDDFNSCLELALSASQPRIRAAMSEAVLARVAQASSFDEDVLRDLIKARSYVRRGDVPVGSAEFLSKLEKLSFNYATRFAEPSLVALWEGLPSMYAQAASGTALRKRRVRIALAIWSVLMIALGFWLRSKIG